MRNRVYATFNVPIYENYNEISDGQFGYIEPNDITTRQSPKIDIPSIIINKIMNKMTFLDIKICQKILLKSNFSYQFICLAIKSADSADYNSLFTISWDWDGENKIKHDKLEKEREENEYWGYCQQEALDASNRAEQEYEDYFERLASGYDSDDCPPEIYDVD